MEIRLTKLEQGGLHIVVREKRTGKVRTMVVPAGQKIDRNKLGDLIDEIRPAEQLSVAL